MQIPPPIIFDSNQSDLNEAISTLPTSAGAVCVAVNGRITFLSSAPNLQRRVSRTFAKLSRFTESDPEQSIAIHCWQALSKLHTSLLLFHLAKEYFPGEYLQRVHLRMPWFVALLNRDPFPRLISTNRIPMGCEPVIGPFARRELAQLYEQEVQGAFLLRRCTETLSPDPQHPGCIYGEIKQCLRPCQCGVERSRYLSEAAEVCKFIGEGGTKEVRDMTKARDQAVASLDFESASRLHKQLDRLNSARAARDPAVGNIATFNGVVLARVGHSQQVQIFPMVQGRWQDPVLVATVQSGAKPAEWDTLVREQLSLVRTEEANDKGDLLEDLALFARWYYSSWREGRWLPFARWEEAPYRKIARSVKAMMTTSSEPEPSLL